MTEVLGLLDYENYETRIILLYRLVLDYHHALPLELIKNMTLRRSKKLLEFFLLFSEFCPLFARITVCPSHA